MPRGPQCLRAWRRARRVLVPVVVFDVLFIIVSDCVAGCVVV